MKDKRTIFDIRDDLLDVLDAVDEEGEYIFGAETIEALQMERHEKRRQIALYILNQKAFVEMSKIAGAKINKKIRSAENRIEYLKGILMQDLDGEKMKEPEFNIYYKTTPDVVDIAEGTELPDEFMRIKKEPNKTALKEALQNGEIIEGVNLVDKVSLVIR